MPTKQTATDGHNELPLSYFACPNSDCANFNRFGADNLSVCEQLEQTIEAVQLDELHGRVVGQVPPESTTPHKKDRRRRVKKKAKSGFTRRCR